MNRALLIFLLSICTLRLHSQKGDIALGIILGNPTGITARFHTGSKTAVEASLGRQIAGINHILLNADFVLYPRALESEGDLIRIFSGAGLGMGFISDLSISVRIPAGAGYYFHALPLEMFAEIVPTLQVYGEGNIRFWPGGYLGLRWIIPKK